MKKSEITKRIKTEARENVPDNYDRILSAVQDEGLLRGEAGTEVYGTGGEAVAAKRRNKTLAGVLSSVGVLLLALVIVLSILLGGSVPAPFDPAGLRLSANDAYGLGAVSTVKLLGSTMPAQAVSTFSAVRSLADEGQTETGVKAEVEKFNEYFTALDSFLGQDLVTTTAEANSDEAYPYEIKLTIKGTELNGKICEYVMYYTEIKTSEDVEDDGEIEITYSLEGVMVQDGTEYCLEGKRTLEEEHDERENELKIRAYADREDKRNYIEMRQETEEEHGGSEVEYVYGVYVDGKCIEETAVEFETERKGGKEETEYKLEFRTGEAKGKYELERETTAKETILKVEYEVDGEKGKFTVREITDENGEKEYEYTFSDGSKKLLKSNNKIK